MHPRGVPEVFMSSFFSNDHSQIAQECNRDKDIQSIQATIYKHQMKAHTHRHIGAYVAPTTT
jgi:hypothetical protein